MSFLNRSRLPALVLFAALLAHWPLLLSNGIFWDDWIFIPHLQVGQLGAVFDQAYPRGEPLDAAFWLLFRYLQPTDVTPKLVSLLALIFISLSYYYILKTTHIFHQAEAAVIAVIAVSYTGLQTTVLLATLNYECYYVVFLAGAILAIIGHQKVSRRYILLRIASYPLILIGFNYNATLVLTGPLALYLWIVTSSKGRPSLLAFAKKPSCPTFTSCVTILLYPILSIFYWIIKLKMFPSYGVFVGYNALNLHPSSIIHSLDEFVWGGLISQMTGMVNTTHLGLGLAAASYGLTYVLVLRRHSLEIEGANTFGRSDALKAVALGLLLFLLAALPYALIGKTTAASGWDSRASLILELPCAILIYSALRLVTGSSTLKAPAFASALAMLVCLFVLGNWRTYVSLEARWVKDRGVMAALAASPPPSERLFWIDDTVPDSFGESSPFYEWAGLLRQAWPDESRAGLDSARYKPDFLVTMKPYLTSDYNLDGFSGSICQADMAIAPGPEFADDWSLVRRYTIDRLLHPGSEPAWVKGTVVVQVTPTGQCTDVGAVGGGTSGPSSSAALAPE